MREPNIIDKEHDKNEIPEMKMLKQDINHMEEVIIGTEQGTTFPTKIRTLMCNALIDMGAKEVVLVKNTIKTYPQIESII